MRTAVKPRVFYPGRSGGSHIARETGGAHMTVRSIIWRLCALGLLLLLNAMTPQAGIVALAGCLAHLPGPATADPDQTVQIRGRQGREPVFSGMT